MHDYSVEYTTPDMLEKRSILVARLNIAHFNIFRYVNV